jgi:hypothetical protein
VTGVKSSKNEGRPRNGATAAAAARERVSRGRASVSRAKQTRPSEEDERPAAHEPKKSEREEERVHPVTSQWTASDSAAGGAPRCARQSRAAAQPLPPPSTHPSPCHAMPCPIPSPICNCTKITLPSACLLHSPSLISSAHQPTLRTAKLHMIRGNTVVHLLACCKSLQSRTRLGTARNSTTSTSPRRFVGSKAQGHAARTT